MALRFSALASSSTAPFSSKKPPSFAQVAPWMPAGRYRVVASGRALESAEVADWEVTSAAFDISQDPEAEVEVNTLAGAAGFALDGTRPELLHFVRGIDVACWPIEEA